jgi:alcohol-forming fatty acyl-CoA reductase
VPGWTDTISAAGGLSLIGGMGVINFIHGKKNNIADLIPVDIVSNMIIVGTAHQANKKELKVIHSSSSNRRPVTWVEYKEYIFEYLKNNPYNIQLFKPYIEFIENDKIFKARFYLKTELPV